MDQKRSEKAASHIIISMTMNKPEIEVLGFGKANRQGWR